MNKTPGEKGRTLTVGLETCRGLKKEVFGFLVVEEVVWVCNGLTDPEQKPTGGATLKRRVESGGRETKMVIPEEKKRRKVGRPKKKGDRFTEGGKREKTTKESAILNHEEKEGQTRVRCGQQFRKRGDEISNNPRQKKSSEVPLSKSPQKRYAG